jgi:urocanate reductase
MAGKVRQSNPTGDAGAESAQGLTRRNFLTGAALVSVGSAVGAALGGTGQAMAAEFVESPSNIVWDRETDVLIVGTGYAGLCAAIEAADAGAEVLVLEKSKIPGGNSILCAGSAQFGGTSIERAAGIVDSPELMYQESLAWGDYRANRELLRAITATSDDTVSWLQDLGLKFNPVTSTQAGMSVPRTHTPAPSDYYPGAGGISYWTVLNKGAEARGVTTLLQHKAIKFIQEGTDGPVLGLEVQDIVGGKTIHIRARRAVFLGSGGWKSNIAMRVNWDPRLDEDFATGGEPYAVATGEMIMAATDIGADLTGMDFVCEYRFKWGSKIYQLWEPQSITNPTGGAGLSVNFTKAMCVDNNGKRFIDEVTSNLADAQDFAEAFACMDKPRAVWAVTDSTNVPAAWKTALANPQPLVTPCVSADMIYSADTIEELAAKMGVNATNLKNELGKYNQFAANGVDTDFKKPAPFAALLNGPYYAVKAQFFCHDQMSGITVNVAGQVVKRAAHVGPNPVPLSEQEIIPRLYAAGEVAGGYYGNERGHGKIGCIMNISRVVGKNAAAETPVGTGATALTVHTNHTSVTHGHSVTLTSVLSGAYGVPAGAKLSLQVRAPGKSTYTTVSPAMSVSSLTRTASRAYKLSSKGSYYFRTHFAGSESFAPSTSSSVKVVSK